MDPNVPPRIAAAVPGRLTPARRNKGIIVGPTAAAHPAAEGIAMQMKYVIAVAAGISSKPSLLNGADRSFTK